jgi:hypothetical protein
MSNNAIFTGFASGARLYVISSRLPADSEDIAAGRASDVMRR